MRKIVNNHNNYTSSERMDDILDKISKYGIESIRDDEKDFLNSFQTNKQEEIHNKLISDESGVIFEDHDGYFKFELDFSEKHGDEMHYIGTLYVPDLTFSNGKKIDGRLLGRIISYKNGSVSVDFYFNIDEKTIYDVFEFCDGLEYELDTFIDYIVSELNEKKS